MSNPISHKAIWHIPNFRNSEFKAKKWQVFRSFYFSLTVLENASNIFLGQYLGRSPPLHPLSTCFFDKKNVYKKMSLKNPKTFRKC